MVVQAQEETQIPFWEKGDGTRRDETNAAKVQKLLYVGVVYRKSFRQRTGWWGENICATVWRNYLKRQSLVLMSKLSDMLDVDLDITILSPFLVASDVYIRIDFSLHPLLFPTQLTSWLP